MNLMKEGNAPLVAIGFLGKGLQLLTHPKLRGFVIFPVLINIVLYSIAFFVSYHYVNQLIIQSVPDWLQWLSWILIPLFFISFFVISFFTFTVLANLMASPFYGVLAARTLSLIDNEAQVVELPMMQVILGELKRVIYILARMLPLLFLSVIPIINIIAPVIWAVFGAWMLAMEFMAYPLENSGLLFVEQRELLKTVRMGALSFGGVTMLGLSLPIINIMIGPAAVIGATLYFHEMSEKTEKIEKTSLEKQTDSAINDE
ncbi:Sulfate transporter CysZ [Patescibacteria group bacterium]|nr:Sulfate transporter CysZ [Patescibacteria group bacterium]